VATWQHQMRGQREEYASCWVHQDCHVADVQKSVLKKAVGVRSIRRKIRVSSEIERERTRLPNQHHCSHTTKDRHLCMRTHQAQKSAEYMTSTGMHVCDTRVACMVRSGLYGRAGLSIGSADRSSHRPLARAIVRSQAGGPF